MAESDEHDKLEKMVRTLFEKSEFELVDTEVHFDFDGDGEKDFSIDVCAIHDKYLIGIECKTSNLSHPKSAINSALQNMGDVIELKNKNIIIKTDLNKITNAKLKNIKEFRYCYAFGKNFKNKNLKNLLSKNGIYLWTFNVTSYYSRVAKVLGIFTRNEILRDFDIPIAEKGKHREEAVKIEQGGNPPMFLLGMHPGLLLQLGYVARRAKKEAGAYQRIINKQRLESLSEYLKNKNMLLANPVIIAFDKETRDDVHYEEDDMELEFPTTYCSAWIIDGQHRIFAFRKTKYKKWSEEVNEELKLPVVAFKDISDAQQTRTFVNINYYQKRIDPILFCDLAASLEDLEYELTWSSLIALRLNEMGPWKDKIKTSETHGQRPLNLNALARHVLLTDLLGYSEKENKFDGLLFHYAKFYPRQKFRSEKNQASFEKQVAVLNKFFTAVKLHTENNNFQRDKWENYKKYGLTKATCVNALLLVLKAIFEKSPKMEIDLDDYLEPIKSMNFTNRNLLRFGRGIPAYRPIANKIIDKINHEKHLNLKNV